MRNIRKAIDGKRLIVDKDERDYRHFLTYYHPVEYFECCVVMAIEITDMVRIQQLLEAAQKMRTTIVRTRDPKKLVESVCETIGKVREICYVEVKLETTTIDRPHLGKDVPIPKKSVLKCLYVDKGKRLDDENYHEYFFSLSVFNEMVGEVIVRSKRGFSSEELQILQTLLDDVAYAMKLNEMSITLARNIVEIAYLVDGIRNPLSAILLNSELYADEMLYGKVREQVLRIIDLLRRLDSSWVESEKIIKTLRLFSER